MTLISFVGNGLIAYGPALVMFVTYFVHHAYLGLLALSSAFFALVALLLAASIWLVVPNRALLSDIVPPPDSIAPAVATAIITPIVQEFVRISFCLLVRISEGGILLASGKPIQTPHVLRFRIAFAIGYGWAVIVILLTHVQLLIESTGPGIRVSPCFVSDIFMSSLGTLVMFGHHYLWTGLSYYALVVNHPIPGFTNAAQTNNSSHSGGWISHPKFLLAYVTVSHLAVSLCSLLQHPSVPGSSCISPILISTGVLGISIYLSTQAIQTTIKKTS